MLELEVRHPGDNEFMEKSFYLERNFEAKSVEKQRNCQSLESQVKIFLGEKARQRKG